MAATIDRRTLLVGAGGVAGVLGAAACTPYPAPDVVEGPWDCGVASGLHSHDAAVLWTRFAPAALSPVELTWEVATDAGFARVVGNGSLTVDASSDGCAKVLAEGLEAGSDHWYRFGVDGLTSPVGRTRTLPRPESEPAAMRLAVGSCQKFSSGWYPAWRHIAEADLDGVLFLGDYIYESTGRVNPLWDVRDDPSDAATDLRTYRAKYRLYRSDGDLRAAHAAHGFVPVWDDHEFVDNYDAARLAEEPQRSGAAYRAWFEYMPVWPIDGTRIHRSLRFGRLAEIAMLDTRQHRDPNPEEDLLQLTSVPPASVVHDPDRTLLGTSQREWLFDTLGSARDDGVVHKVIGQQVMVAAIRALDLDDPALGEGPEHAGLYFNLDQWDGYGAERDRLTAFLHDEGITDTSILTGDIHSFWQAPIPLDIEDAGSPVVAQEYVCGSVASMAVGFLPDVADALGGLVRGFAPSFRWIDWKRRGFGLLEATADSMQVSFVTVDARYRNAPARPEVRFERATGTEDVALHS